MSTPPKKRTAKEIFNAAVEYYEPRQWEGYIVDACGEDEALRQRVRELLEAHRQGDSLLDGNAERTDDFAISERPGTLIGPFKLLQEIGEGGFGVVYMAEQLEPVRRKVALKIIKPGMDTKQVIARFEAERQALAMMDHPNIAKVLDAGATESGRPYFVMELVKGVPVTEFCDTNKLSTRDRLELFVTVCRAVQHAHQKGVIHRDLKPSNVMVTIHDYKPMPVVIDFGVSKAIGHQLTEKTLFTAYGQMVGTPAYMSPEQALMSRMDVDTRSDIYSLGVLLYELLTGSTPLDEEQLRGTAYAEMQRLISEEEAPKPSTRVSTLGNALAKIAEARSTDPRQLGQFLRGDLDWIAMKALEKERNRRYDTANGLANDIERFLNDEAVEACPPSITYQMQKFVGRHRGLVTTGAVVAAAVLLGIIGTTIGMVQARHDAARALVAFQEAERERQRASNLAEEKQAEARRAVDAKQEADRLRDAVQAQLAKQLATRAGMERVRGDITLAALLDAEALSRDNTDPEREANHRRRLAADLRQSPRPTHLFFHDSDVLDVRFSVNGEWIVTACEDGQVLIRSASDGSVIHQLKHEGTVQQAAFQYNDTRLLTLEQTQQRTEDEPPLRSHLWDWKSEQPLAVSPERIRWNLHDEPWRETYPSLSPNNQLQLRSVVDGQPIGPPLDYARTHQSLLSSGLDHMVMITRESAEGESPVGGPGRQVGSFGGRVVDRWSYQGELWNARTGEVTILLDWAVSSRGSGRPTALTSCYSQDHSIFAIQVRSQGVQIHRTDTGEQIQRLEDDTTGGERSGFGLVRTGSWTLAQFSPDNQTLLCLASNEMVLFDVASGEVIGRRVPVKANREHCSFSPNGSRILSMNRQGDPQIWNASTGEAASAPLEHEADVQDLAFSPDGRFVKVVCVDGTIRVWDSLTGAVATPLLKHAGTIAASSFSRDGSHLLVAAGSNVWLWPIGWPEFEQVTLEVPAISSTDSGRFLGLQQTQISPDGRHIVTGTLSTNAASQTPSAADRSGSRVQSEMSVWDSTTGKTVHGPITFAGIAAVTSRPQFSSDGRRILITSLGRRRERGGALRGRPSPTTEATPEVNEIPGSCRVWDLVSGEVQQWQPNEGWRFLSTSFTRDGRRVMTVSIKGSGRGSGTPDPERGLQFQIWNSENGEPAGPPIDHVRPFFTVTRNNLSWSPEGHHIAVIATDSDRQDILVLDTATGEPVGPALKQQGQVTRMVFCDDGRRLMTLADREGSVDLTIWDTATCQPQIGPLSFRMLADASFIQATIDSSVECVAIHTVLERARSNRLLPLSPTVFIHRFDGDKRIDLQHDQGVTDATFDATGELLLTTSLDNVVRIWDPVSGELVRTLRTDSNNGSLVNAQFSSDSARIVTTTASGFRVWEVATGQPLTAFQKGSTSRRSTSRASRSLRRVQTAWNAAMDRFLLQDDQRFVIHDLSADERPIDDLRRMTRVLSGRRVNQLGNIETLSQDQLQEEWEASEEQLRNRVKDAPAGVDWHRLQSQQTTNRYAAIWHLDRLLAIDKSDGEAFLRRGRLLAFQDRHEEALDDFDAAVANGVTDIRRMRANSLAHLKRWSEAAREFETHLSETAEQQDNDRQRFGGAGPGRGFAGSLFTRGGNISGGNRTSAMETLAIARFLDGDRAGYEQACQELTSMGNPLFLQAALLVPRDKEHCEQIAERLDFFSSRGIGVVAVSSLLEPLLALRRGNLDEVVELLGEDPDQNTVRDLLILAMARQQREEHDEAIRLFDLATERTSSGTIGVDRLISALRVRTLQTWVDSAIVEILHREAEQMIHGAAAASDPETADGSTAVVPPMSVDRQNETTNAVN